MNKDRWIGVAGVVLGVISIAFAVWSYIRTTPDRKPTFYVDPTRATIVDAKGDLAPELSVSFRGIPVRNTSVSSVQVYFWNAGKEPVRRGDLLRPLEISMPAGALILTAKLVGVTRDVCGFKVETVATNPNTVRLLLDIAEKDDGARLQITYAGPADASPTFSGVIVGVRTLLIQKTPPSERPIDAARERRFKRAMPGVILTMAAISGGLLYIRPRRRFPIPLSLHVTFGILLLTTLCLTYLSYATSGVPAALRL